MKNKASEVFEHIVYIAFAIIVTVGVGYSVSQSLLLV